MLPVIIITIFFATKSDLLIQKGQRLTISSKLFNEFDDLQRSSTIKQFEQLLKSESCTRIFQLFNGYQNVLRNDVDKAIEETTKSHRQQRTGMDSVLILMWLSTITKRQSTEYF